ncbi:hypothetical protein IQ07DRAFT_146046 [Pyrenochaeta sp. DS3sAY3a]|nr:hypothetical protein IQ07DRAFT_146046 [Pyrenochaeta sp. DS3sAY3a]
MIPSATFHPATPSLPTYLGTVPYMIHTPRYACISKRPGGIPHWGKKKKARWLNSFKGGYKGQDASWNSMADRRYPKQTSSHVYPRERSS